MKLVKSPWVLALAITAHASAHAVESRPAYMGISLGQATVEDFCDGSETRCDDSAPTLRVYGGTELNSFVNLEFGYRYADDVEASGVFNGVGVAVAVSGHFVDTTLQLGMPEKGPFKLFTKAGLLF